MTSNAPPTPAGTETLSQQTQQNPKKTTNSNKTTSKEIKITAMALGSTVRRSQAAHSSSGPNGEEPEPARTLCSDEIHVPNGDSYAGSLLHNLPHGTGTYFWSDGCMYHGDWVRGICSGTGKFFWPSGSTFHGRVRHGFMHGYGTFTAHNGDKYTGFWSMNLKHGHGRKAYANGDFYEGSWRCGSQHGHGRYVWSNGNQYIGEWRNGVISGRGKLVWANGNCYEGFWEDGLPKGHGIFTWADGSCYVGNWSKNPNEKNGVYYPSNGRPHRAGLGWDQDEVFFVDLGDCKVDCGVKGSNFQDRLRLDADFRSKSVVCRSSRVADSSRGRGKKGGSGDGASVRRSGFERICIWESDGDITCDIVPCRPVSVPATPMSGWGGDRLGVGRGGGMLQQRLVVGREVKRQGEVICEGHKCYELMLNLQLGIRHSVGRSVPATCQDLLPPAFDPKEKVWTRFPPEGTKRTPSHQSNEFKWKDYCPLAFRCLRQIFKIDAIEYMLSLCCNKAFRELMSPGKSGSLFYLTHDDRYMIKTVKKSEVKVLLRMLPSYYNHVRAYENTLLTKFFGLHCIKSTGPNQKKVRFVIMGNIFFSDYTIHRRFDLKGSSHGRTIKPEVEIDETTTLKDLDLNFLFRLQSTWFEELRKQIDRDCEFLEAEGIMDYSLLVGLHFVDKSISRDSLLSDSKHQRSSCRAMPYVRITGSGETHKSGKGTGCLSTVEVRDMDPNRRSCVRLGVNMPARVEQTVRISNCDGQLVGKPTGEIYDVILFFGIIDILQDYDISKKLEHAYKSIQHDPTSISAVDPRQYSKRFREFMYKIFIGDS